LRVLITGGAGYIGSFAARRFLAAGHDVLVYDNLSAGHAAAAPAGRLVVGDLADAALLGRTLAENRIDAVVHFAALAQVGESAREPARYYHNNVACTLGLLELMRRHGVGRFVFSSTCATYGVPLRVPITEEEPQKPISPYGNTKLAVELARA
jgi:UDP-glucose 4-epimerase